MLRVASNTTYPLPPLECYDLTQRINSPHQLTIRDMRFNQPNMNILQIVESYNNMPHSSLHNKSPNEITKDDELAYIHEMEHQVNPYDFKTGDRFRLVLDKNVQTYLRYHT